MNKLQKLPKNQSGAVALITVILLMFVFLLVTLGFLRLAVNEQRQSIDSDLNIRAYYAAESGLEDAKRTISDYINDDGKITPDEILRLNTGSCAAALPRGTDESLPPISSVEDLDIKITCQRITLEPGEFVASVNENASVFIPLIPSESPQSNEVTIQWHNFSKDGDQASTAIRLENSLPKHDCWHSIETNCDSETGTAYPALIKAGLYSHPVNSIDRGSIDNRVAYLNPSADNVGTATLSDLTAKGDLANIADCNTNQDSQYACSLTIDGLENSKIYYLRLTSLYRGAEIFVTMKDRNNAPLKFANAQAVIDVTGSAGDVIRRIEARIPLANINNDLEEAITTAGPLCKNVKIDDSGAATNNCSN